MTDLEKTLSIISKKPIAIIDAKFSLDMFTPIDLSVSNTRLKNYNITSAKGCQDYIDKVLNDSNAKIAFGGYLEHRSLYSNTPSFNSSVDFIRNIHLGLDIWAPTGTSIITPMDGKIHSFKNNAASGDYGPTIILEHCINKIVFYTLYGHLSISSLEQLYVGKEFKKGEILAEMGAPEVNVNYASHLHFQIIKDLQGNIGDYPGVCSKADVEYYSTNCPNPNLLLSLEV